MVLGAEFDVWKWDFQFNCHMAFKTTGLITAAKKGIITQSVRFSIPGHEKRVFGVSWAST
jgi:hypothetical protein